MAGTAIFVIAALIFGNEDWMSILKNTMIIALVVNLFTLVTELTITHPTTAAKMVVKMITKGRYKNLFWLVTVLIGNIIPLALLFFGSGDLVAVAIAIGVLTGILITEKIWVEAPQRIPLA
jgi:hypothetical protein